MSKIYVICPNSNPSEILRDMIESSVCGNEFVIIRKHLDISSYKNKKFIFAMELDAIGLDLEMLMFIKYLHIEKISFEGSIASVLMHSQSELYTKRASQDLVFILNSLGCSFIGHPLIEATQSMKNFQTWQKVYTESALEDICMMLCKKQGARLKKFQYKHFTQPKVLLLYSSPNIKSNTLALWDMVKKDLYEKQPDISIKEIQIEHGEINDCKGCLFDHCIHFGERNGCFYGGQMVKEVLPAIEDSDVIIWLAPNYNDTLSANLTAVVNRLTVLYRKIKFYDKKIYALVVSGNSGSDSVTKQLIGGLNINKGFFLPPNFALLETANDPNAIFNVEDIHEHACEFASHILDTL